MRYTFILSFIFTTLGFLLFQLFPGQLIRMFSSNPELLTMGEDALRKISLAFPAIGPSIVGATTFQSLGRGFPSLMLSLARQIIFLFPLAMILMKLGGLSFVWYAFPMAEFLSLIFMFIWLKHSMPIIYN